MLIYSTILNVKDTLSKEKFVRLVIDWVQGSPHQDSIIPDIEWDGIWDGKKTLRYGNNALWLEIMEYRNKNIIAARYEKAERDGVIWDTDFVINFTERKIAVRLDRSYMPFFQAYDSTFSIPYFITLLIKKEYMENDGILPVNREPYEINESNIALLADIICYKQSFHLPVVYVSKTIHDEDPVQVIRLANCLRGIAHVLVQKACWLNPQIRELCQSKNEYYGAIGIYFPFAPAKHIRYLFSEGYRSSEILFERVVQSVFSYSNSRVCF